LFDEVDLSVPCSTWKQSRLVMTLNRCLFKSTFHAGHIVGAACISSQHGERSLLHRRLQHCFQPTTEGLKLAELPSTDVLITESTYGADAHPARKTQKRCYQRSLLSLKAGGNVLPAFAIPRTRLKKFCWHSAPAPYFKS